MKELVLAALEEQERALRRLVHEAEDRGRRYEKQIYMLRWQETVRAEMRALRLSEYGGRQTT